MSRRNEQPQRILDNYSPHRDTQWTRNSDAIRRFIGGGEVEVHFNFNNKGPKWFSLRELQAAQLIEPNTMWFFHQYQCRSAE